MTHPKLASLDPTNSGQPRTPEPATRMEFSSIDPSDLSTVVGGRTRCGVLGDQTCMDPAFAM